MPPHGRTVNPEQTTQARGWTPGTYRVIVSRSGDEPRAVVCREGSTRVLTAEEWLPLVTALYFAAIGEDAPLGPPSVAGEL